MRNLAWAVAVVAGLGLARPATGDGPPVTDTQGVYEEATASTEAASAGLSTITVEEVRSGAGSMEPSDGDAPQDRSERAFVENVWNSP
ncbi:MAG TPA: hypothetical protein VFM45_03405 [Anaeromyxobacteraceae bacterium]|nr:hypothetical protein [Anaeromyxobacteraceae bacterium]